MDFFCKRKKKKNMDSLLILRFSLDKVSNLDRGKTALNGIGISYSRMICDKTGVLE